MVPFQVLLAGRHRGRGSSIRRRPSGAWRCRASACFGEAARSPGHEHHAGVTCAAKDSSLSSRSGE
eukprot:CAMPEP_0170404262 /NCGR_PEP_ID=MMETSP0117_2-20130122/26537_1 /TAXON_ID=400756 /ORGANISM="Durinskia baltica, Strain CSIRO CS-38" /LENGTH=65 /DNA_ID=CAMNT_0010661265 /DNA_START=104 /DNA_END=298 /DNA_ORIENTATION=+